MRILFFGDSVVYGFGDVDGGWVERIRKHYDSKAIKDLENSEEPVIFNLGIDGNTTYDLLQRIENETKARMWPDDPMAIVISIGTNDDLFENNKQWTTPEEFRNNLEKIIQILKPLTEDIIFVGSPACDETKTTPVFWGEYYYTNAELQRSEQIMAEVSNKYNLSFVPVFERFKVKLDSGDNLLTDGLHPNDKGHKFIADLVLPVLDKLLDK